MKSWSDYAYLRIFQDLSKNIEVISWERIGPNYYKVQNQILFEYDSEINAVIASLHKILSNMTSIKIVPSW